MEVPKLVIFAWARRECCCRVPSHLVAQSSTHLSNNEIRNQSAHILCCFSMGVSAMEEGSLARAIVRVWDIDSPRT